MYVCLYPVADLCLASHAHAMGLPAGLVGVQEEGTCLVSQGISRRGHTTNYVPVKHLGGRREDAVSPQVLPSPENHLRRNRTVCASTGKQLSRFIFGMKKSESVELSESLAYKRLQ